MNRPLQHTALSTEKIWMQVNSYTPITVRDARVRSSRPSGLADMLGAACECNDVEEVISIIKKLESSKLQKGYMTSKYRKCAGPGHIILDSHGSLGYPPLHDACRENAIDCIKILLDSGCNPNARCSRGRTPLHVAAFAGNSDVVQLLLDHPSSDIDILDHAGRTALHFAVQGGSCECVLLLLLASIDEFCCDNGGKTALELVQSDEIRELLDPTCRPSAHNILSYEEGKNSYIHGGSALHEDTMSTKIAELFKYFKMVYPERIGFDLKTEVTRAREMGLHFPEDMVGKTMKLLRFDWKLETCKVLSYDGHKNSFLLHWNQNDIFSHLEVQNNSLYYFPGWHELKIFIKFREHARRDDISRGVKFVTTGIKVRGIAEDLVAANNTFEWAMILITIVDSDLFKRIMVYLSDYISFSSLVTKRRRSSERHSKK